MWKEQEEQLLKSLNVNEDIILQLRQYDWEAFKADRRIRRKQDVTSDKFIHNNLTFLSACSFKAHIVMNKVLFLQAFYFIFLLKESYTTKHGEVSCRFLQLVQFKTV